MKYRRDTPPADDRANTSRVSFWSRSTPGPGRAQSAAPHSSGCLAPVIYILTAASFTDAQRASVRRRSVSRPSPLPPQLLAHLRRWKRQGQRFAVEWNGHSVKSIRKAFASAVQDARLGDDVIPHTLRHTAATWLMQTGTDMWQAAGYLGMTVEMLSARYGHHHPEHLSKAIGSFARHREASAEPLAG